MHSIVHLVSGEKRQKGNHISREQVTGSTIAQWAEGQMRIL